MRWTLIPLASLLLFAETPTAVLDLFRTAADALADDNAAEFLNKFDRDMPDYAALRADVQALLAAHDVGSTIDIVSDEGDEQKRTLQLDWLLVTSEKNSANRSKQSRRRLVTCEVQRRGRQWKITALHPLDLFHV